MAKWLSHTDILCVCAALMEAVQLLSLFSLARVEERHSSSLLYIFRLFTFWGDDGHIHCTVITSSKQDYKVFSAIPIVFPEGFRSEHSLCQKVNYSRYIINKWYVLAICDTSVVGGQYTNSKLDLMIRIHCCHNLQGKPQGCVFTCSILCFTPTTCPAAVMEWHS